jgi:hypothetical protein
MSTLYSNTTGFNNTAIGTYSLSANSTGSGNTASGPFSLDIIPKFRTCSKIIEPFEKSTEMR